MRRDIDLHYIAPEHEQIHAELDNWGRWSNPRNTAAAYPAQPVFQGYSPYYSPRNSGTSGSIDVLAALKIQKAVIHLPEKNRHAITWAYVHPYISDGKMCRKLGVGRTALAHLVSQSRTMIKNILTR